MTKKKKYLIELFLKCSQHRFAAEKNLKAHEDLLRAQYPSLTGDEFTKIMSEHGLDSYVEKITLILDEMFSQEEIDTMIAFFRSPTGRKLVDRTYLLKIPTIISDIIAERENKLSKMEKE